MYYLRITPILFVSLLPLMACGQDAAESWEVRSAERFKPVPDAARAAIEKAVPDKPSAKPKASRRILVFYRCEGFIHTSIPHANVAIEAMGSKTGAFDVDLADSYEVFTNENLKQYDCVLLNSTSKMQFPTPAHQNAFLDFVSGGKGLAGFHAASDNFGRHPKCRALVGGEFGGHPWTAGGNWAFKLDDPTHVLNRAFSGKGFWHTDEIYQYLPDSYEGPDVLRILVSLDMSKEAVSSRIDDGPREVPVSWVRRAGEGRVFYTNFGHREDSYRKRAILQHMLDGIQYALGDLEADDIPTAKSTQKAVALAPDSP